LDPLGGKFAYESWVVHADDVGHDQTSPTNPFCQSLDPAEAYSNVMALLGRPEVSATVTVAVDAVLLCRIVIVWLARQ